MPLGRCGAPDSGGRARFAESRPALAAWLKSLRRTWKNESALQIIRPLDELLGQLEQSRPTRQTEVQRRAYLCKHKLWIGSRNAPQPREPLGGGATEATCTQYPCRFHRIGHLELQPEAKPWCV